MILAVASGKGGTGKTSVSLCLARMLGSDSLLLDCDVEEPNCHLFTGGKCDFSESVAVEIPRVESAQCTGCGICVAKCRFHALAQLGKRILIFPELCHSCGGCMRSCPEKAMKNETYEIGKIETRNSMHFRLMSGVLNVGQGMGGPLIRSLKKKAEGANVAILDAPPGNSCAMVSTIRDCDAVILVTEPTPFGLHDLRLAAEVLRKTKTRGGVILNRAGEGDEQIEEYCRKEKIPLWMKIPFSREAAEAYSKGKILLDVMPYLEKDFQNMWKKITGEIK